MVDVSEPTQTTVLVGQNYFDPADRYKQEKGVQVEKFITTFEFLNQKVYGCQVVVTNLSTAAQTFDVLLQIPYGAVPVNNGFVLSSRQLSLQPYSTQKLEYQFYFPFLGEFGHYPVHVALEEALVACGRPVKLFVVHKPTIEDTTSWDFVSQQGTVDQVITFLETRNLAAVRTCYKWVC